MGGDWRSLCSTWGDMENDGDLDLFVCNYGRIPSDPDLDDPTRFETANQAQLYENIGNGLTFVDQSHVYVALPEVHDAYNAAAAWQDMDADGDNELLVLNDFAWARPSVLLWNEEGALELDDGGAGFGDDVAGLGLAVGDVDGDLLPDFLRTSRETLSLLISRGDGTWREEADDRGLVPDTGGDRSQVYGWGAELVDIDNDGDLDAPVAFGYWDDYEGNPEIQPDALFIQEDDGSFVDRAVEWEMDETGPSRGLVTADLNNDGWPDLVTRVLGSHTPLYLSRCGTEGWLRIAVRGLARNPRGVGTEIRVTAGDETWVRWIRAGHGIFTGGPAEAHFGFGDLDSVDTIEILWPNGEVTVFEDVDTRQVLTVVRTGGK